MPHTTTWDVSYEGVPADTDAANTLGDVIRDLKRDIRERMEGDHDWDDVVNAGQHKKVSLQEQAGDPTTVSNIGYVYTKMVGAATELFYKNDAGTVVQLTSGGFIGGATAILLNNNVALQGKESGGTARDLAKVSAANKALLGSLSLPANIQANGATALKADYGSGEQTIWHAGNDGTGSGLDADTVRGAEAITYGSGVYAEQIATQTLATNNNFTFAHGFGATPRLFSVRFRCATAEAGWAVGDEIEVSHYRDFGAGTYNAYANATVVGLVLGGNIGFTHKTAFTDAVLTPANWRLVFRAWK